jgi:hypothetical protein
VIIIWGHRWYGRAFQRGEQGLATRAFHLWYVPLIPERQLWVLSENERGLRGTATRWSLRALLPVFALPWGGIAALVAGAAIAPVAALPVGGGALAAWVWGLRANRTKGGRDDQKRALTHRMIGTSCPAELFTADFARAVAPKLDDLWAQACPDRSPEDVAALGPRDRREAALAYTTLAVRAQLETGERAARLRALAEKVVEALERTPAMPDGAPYRAEVRLPESAG